MLLNQQEEQLDMMVDVIQHHQVPASIHSMIGGVYQETFSSHKIIPVSNKMFQQILKWDGLIGQDNVFNSIQLLLYQLHPLHLYQMHLISQELGVLIQLLVGAMLLFKIYQVHAAIQMKS